MKRLLPFLICLMLQVGLLAQDSKPATDASAVADSQPTASTKPAATSDRMFFPKDWYWGWAQFDITPPHNETDPNLCAANAGQFGGVNSQCSAFGRYMISGTVELRPFGRTMLRRVNFFYDPTFPVRQEHSANSVHLVVERHWYGVLLGRRNRSA